MSTTVESKRSRQRNPAFPAIGLKEAVARAQVLHEKEPRKHMAPGTAASHWGYSVKSSAVQQILSALKQFGLLREDKTGTTRKVRLSDLAERIILDKREESPGRLEAIRKAALTPKVYAELWGQAGEDRTLPSDTQLEHYLRAERSQPFYEDAIQGLISDFRSTIAFANLDSCDIIDEDGGESGSKSIKVGDFVQWTSHGVAQFPESLEVTGLSDDGEWAFVKGSKTGVRVSELTTEKKPDESTVPPINPGFVSIPPDQGTKEFPLYFPQGRGRGLLRIPETMTENDFKLLKDQIDSCLTVTKATTTFVDCTYFDATLPRTARDTDTGVTID